MTNKRQAIVEAACKAFNQGNLTAYLENLYAPDCVFHFLPATVPPDTQGAKLFYGSLLNAFPDAQLLLDNLIVVDDKLAARFCFDMTHLDTYGNFPRTWRTVKLQGVSLMRWVEDRVVEQWSEANMWGLMQQLG
jgi:predicted ester cyclase